MKRVITQVSHEHCLPLRHAVLWPNTPLEHARVPGDEHAEHYAMLADAQMLCCLSVFSVGSQAYQIRKFATAAAHQGKGYGTELLTHVIGQLQASGATSITLAARETALGFYQRFGFESIGPRYTRDGVHFIKVALDFP